MGTYDTHGGAAISPEPHEEFLKPSEFRDLLHLAIARDPSMGDEVDVTDMQMYGDGLGDPHGTRIHVTLESGERFAVIVKALTSDAEFQAEITRMKRGA